MACDMAKRPPNEAGSHWRLPTTWNHTTLLATTRFSRGHLHKREQASHGQDQGAVAKHGFLEKHIFTGNDGSKQYNISEALKDDAFFEW
jgi:hypothetical protein